MNRSLEGNYNMIMPRSGVCFRLQSNQTTKMIFKINVVVFSRIHRIRRENIHLDQQRHVNVTFKKCTYLDIALTLA